MEARTGYADIAAHYRNRIAAGELKPGDPLPTVNEAAELHQVARNTAVRAYALLKREGLVTTHAGAGTVVANRAGVAPATGAARVDRLKAGGSNYAPGETSTGHEAMLRSCTDPGICRDLEIEPHDEVVIRRRVFRRDGKPVILGISVIHPRALAEVPILLQQGRLDRLWHEIYEERTGRAIHRSPEMHTARHASDDELAALEVPVPEGVDVAVPVLIVRTVWHDENGPIEVWEDIHAPGTWHETKP
ncbi:GntR family transcriptional regulator [Streptomyces sp. NRRL B-24484]|uniref:GntR family transcriptional regulator n=1 Tax=Streptomyces sp. NRRL B-24484 TaxID=1463833 RepID=UPI0004C091A9|nr:GntR family transcriptional regulator [Streptomyces sp. NRRL B-24484]